MFGGLVSQGQSYKLCQMWSSNPYLLGNSRVLNPLPAMCCGAGGGVCGEVVLSLSDLGFFFLYSICKSHSASGILSEEIVAYVAIDSAYLLER